MKTKEELKALKEKFHELTNEELEQVTGGALFGYDHISSLDGITTGDVPYGFVLDGIAYTRTYMTTRDVYGNVCEIYCGEGHMAIIPQG